MDTSMLPLPKPEPRRRTKGRNVRAEGKIKISVRALCVERDGSCRIANGSYEALRYECKGPSEWCHLHSHRRSQTRGQAAERRHTTAGSFMACTRHHDQYDGRQKPRLFITCLDRRGCDGPLKIWRGKS